MFTKHRAKNIGSSPAHWRLLPILVGTAGMLATLFVWFAVHDRETALREQLTEARLADAGRIVETHLETLANALQRMAQRGEIRAHPAHAEWLADAGLYLRHDADYRALLWLDTAGSARWWVARTPNGIATDRTGVDVRWVRPLLAACRARAIPGRYCAPGEGPAQNHLLIILPVSRDETISGYVAGIFDLQHLLSTALHPGVLPAYAIAILDRGRPLYQRAGPEPAAGQFRETALALPGLDWRLRLWPAPGELTHAPSLLSILILVAGLLMSALLAVTVRMTQISVWRRRELEGACRKLKAENQVCLRAQETIRQRESILKTVSGSADRLLRADTMEQVAPAMLRSLGETLGVSRVYVFENHADVNGEPLTSQRYEWTAPGIESQMQNPVVQNFPWRAGGMQRWAELLGQGKAVTGLAGDFPASEQAILAPRGIASLVVVPIFTDQVWWGFIGFDECRTKRVWEEAEITALRAAASVLGGAIGREHAARELHESEQRFRQFAEHIHQVFWIADIEQDRVLYVNPAYETVWGQSRRSLYENTLSFLDPIHPEDRERMRATHQKTFTARINFETEYRILRPDGGIRWVRARGFPIKDETGRIYRLAGIAEDITYRKQAEEARLKQAERQRDALVREVHHRIKNNLQGVMGLLRQHMQTHPELAGVLEDALTQIHSIATVHGLHSRTPHRHLRLDELVRAVARLTEEIGPPGAGVALDLDDRPVVELADTEAVPVALIVNELICNAVKHSTASGEEPAVKITLSCDGATARLCVQNPSSGPLPAFDFESGRGLGTGLGLVRSLLPSKGASLRFVHRGQLLETELCLQPPAIAAIFTPAPVEPEKHEP